MENFYEPVAWEDPLQAVETQSQPNPQYIKDLETAINDELHAIHYYAKLIELAPDQADRQRIAAIRQDEIRHYHHLYRLYMQMTGRHPQLVPGEVPTSYAEGLHKSLHGELEAVEFYHRMHQAATDEKQKLMWLNIANDEQRHATWFLYLLAKLPK